MKPRSPAARMMAGFKVPSLGWASFRRRILFRGVFALLACATLALALVLLKDEKQRSYTQYQHSLQRTLAEVVAKLRHPTGQLALLNAQTTPPLQQGGQGERGLSPLVLPFGALDFDDQYKAQQAVEMSGCAVQYPDGASLCVAVGNNPYAGGFIYLVGSLESAALVPRERGVLELGGVHRARVTLQAPGQRTQWIAPFEQVGDGGVALRGRLTGFVQTGDALEREARPVRDFRGWIWQNGPCVEPTADPASCTRRTFYSIRLPVDVFREALFQKPRPIWPPKDLAQVRVRLEMLPPGSAQPLFDSDAPGASAPLSLHAVAATLLPAEVLHIQRHAPENPAQPANPVTTLRAPALDGAEHAQPWMARLIERLPVEMPAQALTQKAVVATAVGDFDITLQGDTRSVDQALGLVAARMVWFVGGMLAAIVVAWLIIEVGLIRRITVLTRRAAVVSHHMHDAQAVQRVTDMDLSDLRGQDELGILAAGLSDLLQRVKDDVRRETLRAQRERDMWHAVGHEIMSPLQSLMVLHGTVEDPSYRYVHRMQQAVRVLYGSASPSEAFEAVALDVDVLDVNSFLQQVAGNAHFAGIDRVEYTPHALAVMARADAFSLEDVVTHVLSNAQRHRTPGTPITVQLAVEDHRVRIDIHNVGPHIDPHLMDAMFEYGVSTAPAAPGESHRGQGLFVVKTYLAKMGGEVSVHNTGDGVQFTVFLQKA
jgi:two-component system, OmpR family, sensor kinase